MTKEALKLALEALKQCRVPPEDFNFGPAYEIAIKDRKKAIAAIREALAAPQGEPVARCGYDETTGLCTNNPCCRGIEADAIKTAGAVEPIYAFRRKGLDDFCTCDEVRYLELSEKSHLFEVTKFYTHPAPAPLSDEPVAFMQYIDKYGDYEFNKRKEDCRQNREIIPLYTHPAPAPHTPNYTTEAEIAAWKAGYGHGAWSNTTPAPAPLSEAEIAKIVIKHWGHAWSIHTFARAIERHVRAGWSPTPTAPAPLSDKEIRKLQSQYPTDNNPMQFARAIERHVRGGE